MTGMQDAPRSGVRLICDRLARAEALRAKLAGAPPDAAALSETEDEIASLNLGVTAWTDIDDGRDVCDDRETRLGFRHDRDGGRLVVRHGGYGDRGGQVELPLLDAPPPLRREAARQAANLVEQLLREAWRLEGVPF